MSCRNCECEVDVEEIVNEYAEEYGFVRVLGFDISNCVKCLEGSDMPECPLGIWEQVTCVRRLGGVKLPSVEWLTEFLRSKECYSEYYVRVDSDSPKELHEEFDTEKAAQALHSALQWGKHA